MASVENNYVQGQFSVFSQISAQPTFTFLKLTTETLEQGRNIFKVNYKDFRTTPMASF